MIRLEPDRLCGEEERIEGVVDIRRWRDEIIQLGILCHQPIMAELDKMKVGKGLQGVGAPVSDCIVVCHCKRRKTYYSYVLALRWENGDTYVSRYLYGDSINYRGTMANMGNSFVATFLQNKAKAALTEEGMFYDAVDQVVQKALKNVMGPRPKKPAPCPQPNPGTQPPRPQPDPARTPSPQPPVQPPAEPPAQQPQSAPKPVEKSLFTCPKCGKRYSIQKRSIRIAFTCTKCGCKFGVNCADGSTS